MIICAYHFYRLLISKKRKVKKVYKGKALILFKKKCHFQNVIQNDTFQILENLLLKIIGISIIIIFILLFAMYFALI